MLGHGQLVKAGGTLPYGISKLVKDCDNSVHTCRHAAPHRCPNTGSRRVIPCELGNVDGQEWTVQDGMPCREERQNLTASAAATARPCTLHQVAQCLQESLEQHAPALDFVKGVTDRHHGGCEGRCLDEALKSGAFDGRLRSCAREATGPIVCEHRLPSHRIVHSLAAHRTADQLMRARKIQVEVRQISGKACTFQYEAQV